MILYLLAISYFIKSLKPLIFSKKYSNVEKIKILKLEVYFLIKCIMAKFLNKKITQESFLGHKLFFTDYLEFAFLFLPMFGIQEYSTLCKKKNPVILDCGSNFGLSIAFFKYFYKNASITAIEANPGMIPYILKNIKVNNYSKVKVINAMVSSSEGESLFYVGEGNKWTMGNSGIKSYRLLMGKTKKIKVKAIKLSNLIKKKINILKLDIEGMECEVLNEAKSRLHLISEIMIEFHGSNHLPKNSLEEILKILDNSGFKYTVSNTTGWRNMKNNYVRIIHAINKRNCPHE